ncbi:TonB-dependent receptor domain-containing protein [Psychroflexus maritimus]|uniref:TonB-dependent receptor n=1 Tax=Psychroflexus maritimus TaxID=2714865 RepID=A0A967DZE5_9FLAO|nr:TonB-dependent receptor [Psychroflexus maritimus]NGZ90860.1 TonB-dependent receptor [Psychroflexus maritimus]
MVFKQLVVFICLFASLGLQAQISLQGKVLSEENQKPIKNVQIWDTSSGKTALSDEEGNFKFESLAAGQRSLVFLIDDYAYDEKIINLEADADILFRLKQSISLSEVVIQAKKRELFQLRRLNDVEDLQVNAGKKNEVVLVGQMIGNKSNSNARQVYAQVAGLNIYESTNCGLQLSIGGRGLDPNRTSNFNTRQNGYDISADVLGYPESYYTPPTEALEEIQIIRGAASLQYGTQFGGLINFKLRTPSAQPLEVITRQSFDTNCGFSSFNSISGTNGKFSHYTYVNYKNNLGMAPRDNMSLEAINAYTNLNYQFTESTKLAIEYTHLSYLAQQAGGLTDVQFNEDPTFSNRTRNWFRVNWNLLTAKFNHQLSEKSKLSFIAWGMNSSRDAIGFRTDRVSQIDNLDEPRDLERGNFVNWGAEFRYLTEYKIGTDINSTLLLGSKYYHAKNAQRQGPGSRDAEANFDFINYPVAELPTELRQSDFDFPNLNVAFFGENIFYLNDKFSVTPGLRLEYIKTEAEGTYRSVNRDLAGNALQDSTFVDQRSRERMILLGGVGVSYKPKKFAEVYANLSRNYRSVTFNDIRIVNPSFQVDPNIKDEDGFTADVGFRGRYKKKLSFDANVFGLWYNDIISEVQKVGTRINAFGEEVPAGRVVRFRGNIGNALIYGLESLVEWNIKESFFKKYNEIQLNYYVNLALTQSVFVNSEETGVEGNELPFVPNLNLRTGLKAGYKNFLLDFQYSYLSEQFTDATNAPQDLNDNQSGIIGTIPAYGVFDLSFSYRHRKWTLETGVNNLLDESYFTQRATGYPGPGIIPALPRSFYATLEFKF